MQYSLAPSVLTVIVVVLLLLSDPISALTLNVYMVLGESLVMVMVVSCVFITVELEESLAL